MPNTVTNLPLGFEVQFNTREPGGCGMLALPKTYADKVEAWFAEHPCTDREHWLEFRKSNPTAPQGGVFGSDRTWILTPTTVGLMVDVQCSCKAILEDVTDLANHW
jgi:hypothetical protein